MIETIVEKSVLVSERLREILGISWEPDSGKFVKCGKFKDKQISPDSFITVLCGSTDSQRNEFRGILIPDNGIEQSVFPRFVLESYLERFPFPFRISSGKAIHDVFERFRPGSCMRYSECREFREFYACNPDRIKTIHWEPSSHELMISEGSLLLWISKAGTGYRDRIYSNSYLPYCGELIRESLDSRIISEFGESLGISRIVDIYGNSAPRTKLTGFRFHSGLFPYMDTLSHCSIASDGTVSVANYSYDDSVDCKDCSGTDVESGESGERCCCCNRRTGEDYHCTDYGDIYCSDCYSENFSYSEYDNSDYPSDSVSCVTLLDSRGREREITISNDSLDSEFHRYSGEYWDSVEYIHGDLSIETTNGEYVSSEDCISGEFDSTDTDFPRDGVPFCCESFVIPWGSDYAHTESELYFWESGSRRIPVARRVPRGFVPRSDNHPGEFVKKFGEFLAITFDSSGDSSSPYSVGIRSPFHTNGTEPISVPSGFRFRTESESVLCLRVLSEAISRNPEQWNRIRLWNGSTEYDSGYLMESVKIVKSELERYAKTGTIPDCYSR